MIEAWDPDDMRDAIKAFDKSYYGRTGPWAVMQTGLNAGEVIASVAREIFGDQKIPMVDDGYTAGDFVDPTKIASEGRAMSDEALADVGISLGTLAAHFAGMQDADLRSEWRVVHAHLLRLSRENASFRRRARSDQTLIDGLEADRDHFKALADFLRGGR